MRDITSIRISMIGPFPQAWGGRARGGGVATHVHGLAPVLPRYNVRLSLLADNTDQAHPVPIPELDGLVEIWRTVHPQRPGMLRGLMQLGPSRVGRIAWRIVSRPELRRAAPPSRQLKFVAQAANFDRFLAAQQPDILHVHHAEYRAFLCQQVLGVSVPLVATVHGVMIVLRSQPEWLVSLIEANYRRADWLIAVSSYVKEVIVAHGADPSRVTVIPNGVDVESFVPQDVAQARSRLDLPKAPFIVLFAGSLKPWKGVHVLLKAVQRNVAMHPDMHLVVLGSGPEEDNLRRLAGALGLSDRVTFAGTRPLADMPQWYQACDVLVLPSQAEGFGLAALEAMSCGRPVIVSVPPNGRHDVVAQGETGLLVEYGDAKQLAHDLDLLASRPDLAQRLGANARHLVEREFSWDRVGQRTAEVYRNLLAERLC